MSSHDTIAALATPPGRGGVGILRISGADAQAILRVLAPRWPEDTPSHLMKLARIQDADARPIDEALVVLMRAGRSYTGEDVAEVHCHGGPIILRRALDAALDAGARIARPGEFTERAFLNGRLDLTQAEAVADLIDATSEAAHQLALEHLAGSLGAAVRGLLDELVDAAVLLESAIDFSHEEHIYALEREEVLRRLTHVRTELDALRRRFDQGRRQREGVRVVIAGATNAGKSTLFNQLYGDDRAIVTSVAGTTRDFLEEELILGGVAVRLIDTAGLRETDDEVEAIGIQRSRQWAERADMVVWVVDRSRSMLDEERRTFDEFARIERPMLVLLNKGDLPVGLTDDTLAHLGQHAEVLRVTLLPDAPEGIDALRGALTRHAQALTASEGVLLSRARHLEHVKGALQACVRAIEAVEAELEHEFVALDVREAIDALGEIVGRVTTDDILNKIFSDFCIGK